MDSHKIDLKNKNFLEVYKVVYFKYVKLSYKYFKYNER